MLLSSQNTRCRFPSGLSIRARLCLAALVPVIGTGLILSAHFAGLRLRAIERLELDRARAVAAQLAVSPAARAPLLEQLSSALRRETSFTQVRITGPGGVLLSASGALEPAPPGGWLRLICRSLSRPPLRRTVRAPIVLTGIDPAEATRVPDDGGAPAGWVEIDLDLSNARCRELEALPGTLIVPALTLLIAVAVAWRLSWAAARPLRALTDAVGQLRNGHLDCRANTGASAELGRLESGINAMAATLQAAQQRLEERLCAGTADLERTLSALEARCASLEAAHRSAQTASEDKSRLLASVSHEIRTPISVLLGFSELLRHASEDPLHRNYVQTIHDTTQGLLGLLNALLDVTRIEAGHVHLEKAQTDINALLHDIHALFTPDACRRGIEFHVARLDAAQSWVSTDSLRLRQVLINLVHNALRFTADGHVLLDAEVARTADHVRWVRFTVQDTGAGIPRHARNAVFRAFERGEHHAPAAPGGAGLGLYIVSEIVALMQGDIRFDSVPGKGSRFCVTLPLATTVQAPALPLPTAPLPVLVVDGYPPLAPHRRKLFEQADLRLVERPAAERGIVLVGIAARRLRSGELPAVPADACASGWPCVAYCAAGDAGLAGRLQRAGYTKVIMQTGCPQQLRAELDSALLRAPALPARPARPAPQRSSRLARGDTSRLLLVDDHPVALTMMQHFCRQTGWPADSVLTPSAALALIRRKPYALMLVDLHMPEMDGAELARRVRKGDHSNTDTPIIALTADARHCGATLRRAGIDAVLVKPVPLAMFREVVQRLIRTCPGPRGRPPAAAVYGSLQRLLLERLVDDRSRLFSSAQRGDLTQLASAAHRLYGACLYCDVPRLASAVQRVEQAASTGDPSTAKRAAVAALAAIDELLEGARAPPR